MSDSDINSKLSGQKIGILGFGQEGQAVLKYLNKHELTATIFDENPEQAWSAEAINLAKQTGATIVSGENYLDSIADCTLLFRSPGIWRKHPKILNAQQQDTIITSQTKWFFENSKSKIIGVTGTKGKGTTCSLIYEILKANKLNVYLTGNIGKTQPLEFLDEAMEKNFVVYEMSSFQLQDLKQSPHIGVCLMVTSDHLNHHENLDEYHEAKSAISAFQTYDDVSIYNIDYPATAKIGQLGSGQKFSISAKDVSAAAYISGDYITVMGKSIDCSNRKLRGAHNLENIAAAALVGMVLNIDIATITEVVNNFPGLEHRLQYVGEFNGVSYYNDSISTVPETTLAALNSFDKPIHLILGGSDKGLNYDDMVKNILQRNNVSSITFLGEVGANLKSLFEKQINAATGSSNIKLFGPYTDFELAIKEIKSRVRSGEIVLLSPATASFGMFDNYAQRGHKFVELIKAS